MTRLLFNFHTVAAMDCRRPAHLRRFHKRQAQILAKKLKALQKAPYSWQMHCAEHLKRLPDPLIPLT